MKTSEAIEMAIYNYNEHNGMADPVGIDKSAFCQILPAAEKWAALDWFMNVENLRIGNTSQYYPFLWWQNPYRYINRIVEVYRKANYVNYETIKQEGWINE